MPGAPGPDDRRQADARHVEHPPDPGLSGDENERAYRDAAEEPTPEDEATAREERAPVPHQDRVVHLRADQEPDERADHDVADRLVRVPAPRELAPADILPD